MKHCEICKHWNCGRPHKMCVHCVGYNNYKEKGEDIKMNYMPEVLKMMELEVGERFNIVDQSCNPYLFDEEYNLIDMEYYTRNGLIRCLIIGDLKIEKLPWKPKEGDVYFSISYHGEISQNLWIGVNTNHYYRYNAGNCFKNKKDITPEIKERILKEMKGKYENES